MNEIKKDENKFYIGENSQNALAEITFVPDGESKIIVNHTYVSESLRGQGIALKLVKKVIEYARKENIKIIPLCSYVEKVMTRNEEYKDVLSEK
ncbi:MAG TPA: GNAT family N-acetyltransferase [Clostridium sp.]